MRFYHQHPFYGGIDLDAKTMRVLPLLEPPVSLFQQGLDAAHRPPVGSAGVPPGHLRWS